MSPEVSGGGNAFNNLEFKTHCDGGNVSIPLKVCQNQKERKSEFPFFKAGDSKATQGPHEWLKDRDP